MNKEELIKKLEHAEDNADEEEAHIKADNFLLDYIDDNSVRIAFNSISKWYS